MQEAGGLDDFDLDEIDSLVTKLMGHAFMARAYGEALERDPSLVRGFGKLRDRHRTAVQTLSKDIGKAATVISGMGVVAPFAMRRREGAR